MKKSIWVTVVVLTLAVGVSAQTTNPNYEVTPFGDPPYEDATGRDRDTISVAADGKGSILVLRRSEPPVLVFNREGELQKAWGTGLFTDTHNIDIDHEGYVWIGDRNGQMVYKFTMDGEQLLALGTKGVRGDNSSRVAFNRPSDVAVAANGDIFVADGYDNNRVVHFSKDGAFIKVIGGTAGSAPGRIRRSPRSPNRFPRPPDCHGRSFRPPAPSGLGSGRYVHRRVGRSRPHDGIRTRDG